MTDLQVLHTNSFIVAQEVVLNIQRLVKKYGKELQLMTWHIVLDILECLLRLTEVRRPMYWGSMRPVPLMTVPCTGDL